MGLYLGGFRHRLCRPTLHSARPARHSLRLYVCERRPLSMTGRYRVQLYRTADCCLFSTRPSPVTSSSRRRREDQECRLIDSSSTGDFPTHLVLVFGTARPRLPRQFFGLGSLSFTPTDEPNRYIPARPSLSPRLPAIKLLLRALRPAGID